MLAGHTFLIGTLALNQTVFFEAIGDVLEAAGNRVAYLCFHERSHEHLLRRGKASFNAFGHDASHDDVIDLSGYGWPSLNLLLSHEKAAFEVYDTERLLRKLRRYLAGVELAFEALEQRSNGPVVLVQELGGFLSNIASFYAARRRGSDNVFIEPSFFRRRVFFSRNTFAAPSISGPHSFGVSEVVAHYLRDALGTRQAVIPVKDSHHYRGPLRKLLDVRHIRRLAEKSLDKYVLRKSEEFSHIAGHVGRHVRMLINSQLLSRRYRMLPDDGERFVYYPLHVPADAALTLRAPEYVDQCALIDFIARCIPETHRVFIKEHPALVGAISRRRLVDLLNSRDNITLLHPGINNYEVMKRADAVITVNSKSGAEALLLGRPVIVLGDAFYSQCSLVVPLKSARELSETLARVLKAPPEPRESAIYAYFEDVWRASWPGELYDLDPGNVRQFASSLQTYLSTEDR